MIINRRRKGSDKIQVPFMIKTLQKVSTDGPYLNIIKTVYVKHTANIILNREKLKALPLTTWIRQECSLLPLLFNIFLEVLATTTRKEKEIKGIQGKKKLKRSKIVTMMLHTENPEDATRWLLDLINEQSKLAGYKIYRKLLHFYTLIMIYQKVKLMKQSHSPSQRKEYNSKE